MAAKAIIAFSVCNADHQIIDNGKNQNKSFETDNITKRKFYFKYSERNVALIMKST